MIIEGAIVVADIKPTKDPNSWAGIRANLETLSIESVKDWKVRDYEHRFNIILQTRGRGILQTQLSNLRLYGKFTATQAERANGKKAQTLFEAPVPPKKREYKSNEVLHSFTLGANSNPLRKLLKDDLVPILVGCLKAFGVKDLPEIKMVYVEDPDPSIEVRVK